MRIATWNINSLNVRLERVEAWIKENEPDVLVLQETKCTDAAFPHGAFSLLGYESAHHGNGRWNGVAILSRIGLADVVAGFPDEHSGPETETRLIRARCGSVVVVCVYVPNGRSVGSEHYEAKLRFLERLVSYVSSIAPASAEVLVCGDFNVAPTDSDVFDPSFFEGSTHVTRAEREAVRQLLDLGFDDSFRTQYPDQGGVFSWWDYRAGDFHNGRGMRIDLMLASHPLASRIQWALIDRNARKGQGSKTEPQPSDHAPVILQFAD